MKSPFRSSFLVLQLLAAAVGSGCSSGGGAQNQAPPETPALALTAFPASVSVAPGGSGTSALTTAVSGGFNAPVTLTAAGQPAGVSVAFSPASIAAPGAGTSTVTFTASSGAAAGSYSVTITASGSSLSKTATLTLTIPSNSPKTKLVGYLPDYDGSYATFASTLNFKQMTHLIIGFGVPPACSGACTAASDMTWSLSSGVQSDAEISALVTAAHAAGVKVMLTIGGGDNASDALVAQFYNAGLSAQLVASLDSYVAAHDLDGVDVDIEDPTIMGNPYSTFVGALETQMHSEGKVVSAAVAEWLQTLNVMSNTTLESFDFVNVMVYSNLSDCQTAMTYFASLGLPADKMTLGVPFFGQSTDAAYAYSQILAAYPNAGASDFVSGGSLDSGLEIDYVGDATMAQETQLGAQQYGGIAIWELSQDTAPPNSLLTIIQNNL